MSKKKKRGRPFGSSKYTGKFKINDVYGKWTVIDSKLYKLPRKDGPKYGNAAVKCKCECGKERIVYARSLITGVSKSCGCWFYGRGSANPNWRGVGQIPGTYIADLANTAARQAISYNLTPQYLSDLYEQQSSSCAISGEALTFSSNITNASLDRIDSNQGYIVGNVQWVTKQVNIAKHTTSQEQFIQMCKKVVTHTENFFKKREQQ